MAKGGNSHRNTLKNDHKPFKSKHATKGQLKNQYKGKVEKTTSNNKQNKALSKLERKNLLKQTREQKILETKLTKKLFEGNSGASKIITIICLTKDISPETIANQLFDTEESQEKIQFNHPSINNIKINKFKTNLKVVIPDHNNFLQVLDCARVSDFIIFGLSAKSEVEPDFGETILRALLAQGIGSVLGVVPNLVSSYPKRNFQLDVRQSLQSFFNHFFPVEDNKLFALENETESSNCLRYLCQKFPQSINWRDSRGWVVADKVYVDDSYDGIVIEGTCRGTGLNVNRLVHIPNYGDFQVDKIEKIKRINNNKRNEMSIDEDVEDSYLPDSSQDDLDELNPIDPGEGNEDEDMWDGEENNSLGVKSEGKIYFNDAQNEQNGVKRVPKGTSEYQSRWFVDDVLDEDASDLEEEPQIEERDEKIIDNDGENTTDYMTDYAESEMHIDLSPEEEQRQLEEYRSKLAKEDLEFPDEIELHPNELAREKLGQYRGVKSLGNCEWDVNEENPNKPEIWNQLFKVSNFKATKNRVNKEFIKNIEVQSGSYIRIFIRAPKTISENHNPSTPFVVFELLRDEHKLAITNFSFENWEEYDTSIPNKESMVVQYGPRRQVINPIFNQASNNSNNVHKQENFQHQGMTTIATAITPICFTNSPVIYFKINPENEQKIEFIGKGTYLGSDYSRIIVEKIILTGHPLKIHKNLVTIRYMFFNPEDVNFFKAIQLFTKSGRTGYIKESLGTHGYFKATFDGKLTSQDVVGMSMFKRVYPEMSRSFSEYE
ncbi:TSR1 [Candida pseudojiufengensis]|uniref:TSR1 n=1 Tax=Candida pseudojiufengensis TaxID=497109 RepID=UPI002224476F|nr:TSR1 [Candida pseudojiufengensis]KAI5962665.1 TSR1 [Candida pseudojiufengensis]